VDFTGAKAALFCGSSVLTCLRDDRPDLRWPGLWDLPGGGREGVESAEDCLLRELWEEFGLALPPDRLVWRRVFPSMVEAGRESVFFGGWLSRAEVAAIRFGDEGQGWELMPVEGFLGHGRAVPEMQRRAGIVWQEIRGAHAWAGFSPE
jgi:8-oxo-dGTP diphosphatase